MDARQWDEEVSLRQEPSIGARCKFDEVKSSMNEV